MNPGHYKVNVILNYPQQKAINPPFFEGKLTSSLEFDMLRPLGEDAAFLESVGKWFDIHKIPPEQRCYYILHDSHIDCTDEMLKNQLTSSRVATWILIKEIMIDKIISPREAMKNEKYLRYSNLRVPSFYS